jgi:ABC-2 type transport system permease protein
MKILAAETRAELLKALRAPEFLLPTVLMPGAFYTFFAIAMPGSAGRAGYLLATFGVFAVMGPAIFGFGAGVANERDRGWLTLKRAAPAPGSVYIAAKLLTTLVFAAIALAPIYVVGALAGGVTLPPVTWALLFAVHLAAAVPFVLIGLAIGFSLPGNAAVAVANIVFLALAALGGLWMPIFLYPESLQTFASYLPSYHLGELALWIADAAPEESMPVRNGLALAVMTAVFAVVAGLAWARQRN